MKFFILAACIAAASATVAHYTTAAIAHVPMVKTEYQSQVNHVVDAPAAIAMAIPKPFAVPRAIAVDVPRAIPVPMIAKAPTVYSSSIIDARPAISTFAAPIASTWAAPAISTFGAPLAATKLASTWDAPMVSNFAAVDYAGAKAIL